MNIVQFVEDHLGILSLFVSLGIVNFLIFLPYLSWAIPIGWDTPVYMYYPFYVEKYGVISTFVSGVIDRPGYALILYVLSEFGVDIENTLTVLPLVFGSFYIVSTYLLARESSHDGILASLAALFSSCSLATLRLANDLQPHLLALSCMMMAIYFHLRYVDKGHRRYIIFTVTNALLILLIHPLTYAVYFVILTLSSSIKRSKRESQRRRRETIGMVSCVLPLVGIVLFSLFISLRPVAALAESLLSPSMISPVASQLWVRNTIIQSIPFSILSIIAIIRLLQMEGGTFRRLFLAWTVPFSLAVLLAVLVGMTFAYRFILILPLPILAAYGFKVMPNKARMKYLKHVILIGFFATNLSVATLHQLDVEPKIDEKLKEELIWVRNNLGDKLIVPVYPLDLNKGRWVLGIIGDYLYYGEILPLLARKPENYPDSPNLDPSLCWKRLENDEVFKSLSEYKIVLVDGVYGLSAVDEQITAKVVGHDIHIVGQSVVTNESKIDYYYQIWREFKDAKIAVIGEDWLATKKILYDLWISPVSAWIAAPANIQYFEMTHLPPFSNSAKYDVLILADWDVPLNETEAEKLLEYFNEGCSIVATYKSIYELYMISPEIVQIIFGVEKAYPPNVHYSNLTYHSQHYITSDFSIPFNSTGIEYGVPVSNLTTSQGIALVTSSEDLYLLVVDERNDVRTAHFGLRVSEMGNNDVTIYKRLLLWVLRLESP